MGCQPADLPGLGQEIVSAGTFGFSGGRATTEAVAAAHTLGADVTKHRSRKLTNELIKSADLVFCMTSQHVAAVVRGVSEAADRTYLLDPDGDIADPIGGGVETYLRVARRIERSLRKHMKEKLL